MAAGLIERVRFPGEAPAARRLVRARGFRAAAAAEAHERALRPARAALLGEATRLLPGGASERLERAVAQAAGALGVRGPVEVFQAGWAAAGASLVPGDRPLVVLSREAAGSLDEDELRAVVGQALGSFAAHAGPRAPLREAFLVARVWGDELRFGPEDPRRLRASALLTACEITADRLALVAAGGLDPFVRAQLKLGTDVSDRVLVHDPTTYLAQVREALAESTGRGRRNVARAERHVRARAAELFAESDVFRSLVSGGAGRVGGKASPGGKPIAEVDAEVASLLAGWAPRRASSIEPERLERFLVAAGAAIASADGSFAVEERELLAQALPLGFRGKLPKGREADLLLDDFAREVRRADDGRARLSTFNFLCGLVDADGRVRDAELLAIDKVGTALGARDLFRRLLLQRYGFDPRACSPGLADRPRVPRAAVPPPLARYLHTVELTGERRVSLRKLLRLAGSARRSPRALDRLSTWLGARELETSPRDLGRVELDDEVRVRRRAPR